MNDHHFEASSRRIKYNSICSFKYARLKQAVERLFTLNFLGFSCDEGRKGVIGVNQELQRVPARVNSLPSAANVERSHKLCTLTSSTWLQVPLFPVSRMLASPYL
jgi:hypothetical protein